MNGSININSNSIDLSTLEELRDPNLISRYPPLYNRKQNLINIEGRHQIISRSSPTKLGSTNTVPGRIPQLQPFKTQDSFESYKSPKKRHRFMNFFKGFTKHSSKLSKSELLKQSISKPLMTGATAVSSHESSDSIYMNSLYPTRKSNSIKIKRDSFEQMAYVRNQDSIKRREMYLSKLKFQPLSPPMGTSATQSIVIPPIGSNFTLDHSEVPRFTNRIVHPNLQSPSPRNERNTGRSSRRRRKRDQKQEILMGSPTFARYDLMNLNSSNNGFSPIEDYDMAGPHTSSPYLITSSFVPLSETSDSDESYYSFAKSDEDVEVKRVNSSTSKVRDRKVSSPIYRITHNSPTRAFTSFNDRVQNEQSRKHLSRNRQ